MKTSLVIMAAGIGSRFGGGIKQLEPVGPNGELIIDYSIHDAIQAGFNKIIFIIRKDIEIDFKERIGNRIETICDKLCIEIQYVFQSLDELPEGIKLPEGRTKPWGTGQAVLSCKNLIKEPFVVINADDYYGKEAFEKIHNFLVEYTPEQPERLCMAGFILQNTLSDNGGVTRGICRVNSEGYLSDVIETPNIVKTVDGAEADGVHIDVNSYASMNMWGLTPEFVDLLERGFTEFFDCNTDNYLKAEFLLPIYIDQLLKKSQVSVKVLETGDKWFGITYKEDKINVTEAFKELIEQGKYKENLFEDLNSYILDKLR